MRKYSFIINDKYLQHDAIKVEEKLCITDLSIPLTPPPFPPPPLPSPLPPLHVPSLLLLPLPFPLSPLHTPSLYLHPSPTFSPPYTPHFSANAMRCPLSLSLASHHIIERNHPQECSNEALPFNERKHWKRSKPFVWRAKRIGVVQ